MVTVMTTALRRVPSRKETNEESGDRSKTCEHRGLTRRLQCLLGVSISLIYALVGFRLREPGAFSDDLRQRLLPRRAELTSCRGSDKRP